MRSTVSAQRLTRRKQPERTPSAGVGDRSILRPSFLIRSRVWLARQALYTPIATMAGRLHWISATPMPESPRRGAENKAEQGASD
jgi:hypothetical protein